MEEEVKLLIKENTKLTRRVHDLTKEIDKTTKRIRRFTIVSEVIGFIKLLIIFIPVILGILYLPPMLKDFMGQYQKLFGLGTSLGGGSEDVLQNALMNVAETLDARNIEADGISPELLKILNNK